VADPANTLLEILTASWVSQATYVAAKLGVADLIASGVDSPTDLAQRTDSNPAFLERVLKFLVGHGVLSELSSGRFGLTAVGELLRSDAPLSLRELAILYGEESYVAWGHLLDAVRTGSDAFAQAYGQKLFEYLSERPDRSATFNAAMAAGSAFFSAIPEAYDLSVCKTVADIGGGSGALVSALLKRQPHLRGVVADSPQVVEATAARLAASGLADRCEVAACDFFTSVPAGADTYLLSRILHDWDYEHSITILQNIRSVIPADGRLLVIERIIPDEPRPSLAIAFDVQMLVMSPSGKERTLAEYDALFAESGFRRALIADLPLEVSLIEALPI
jgi:hypothetical protein